MTDSFTAARTAAADAIVASVETHGRAATARIGAEMAFDLSYPIVLKEIAATTGSADATAAELADALTENAALRREVLRAEAVIKRASELAVNASWNLPELRDTLEDTGDIYLLEGVIREEVSRRLTAAARRRAAFEELREFSDEIEGVDCD